MNRQQIRQAISKRRDMALFLGELPPQSMAKEFKPVICAAQADLSD
jgi:hypothetical protein